MSWTHEQKSAVWWKGIPVEGQNKALFQADACGALIGWGHYGNRNSEYGWEVDHINPNGGDDLSNLRPLQWQNNAAKSDGKLVCAVAFNGQGNVPAGQVARGR